MSSIKKAQDAFDEARRSIDPRKDPVQYNLFVGLFCMAEAIEKIEREVYDIRARIR